MIHFNTISDTKDSGLYTISNIEELRSEYLKKNIIVSFSTKMIGTTITDQPCVTFQVKEKLPIDQVSEEDMIPASIVIDGKEYLTDVVSVVSTKLLSCFNNCDSFLTTPPGNRNKVRPLKGGVSISSKSSISGSNCTKGTLGFIAVDSATQSLVGVTAAHIVCNNFFYTASQDLNGIIENQIGNDVYQDGETCIADPTLKIGQVIRYAPMYKYFDSPSQSSTYFNNSPTNVVDAALISLSAVDVSNTESWKQYGVNYTTPLPFASQDEIFSLSVGISNNKFSYSGRTAGVQGGTVCPLSNYSALLNIYIDYPCQGGNVTTLFPQTIKFFSYCYDIIPGEGDSGAALVANFNGVDKIVGIIFATATMSNGLILGIACPISYVAAQLGIEAWDGTPKNFIDPSSIAYTTVPGKSARQSIKKDGKIYWQVGLTNN